MFSRKDLIKLIIPLIIEQILIVTVGMADGIMVARVGESAVSGVSLVDSINVLLIGLFSAMATGGAVVSAQFLGRREEDNACKAGEQLIISTLCLSLIIMILTFIFRSSMLKLLFGKAEADVMANALTYMFWTSLSFPFIAVYNSCAALFRSMGNSKISMVISAGMNLMNIIGNSILIFGLGMGVAGAAIATLISRIFAAATMFILLNNKSRPIHIEDVKKIRFDIIMIKRILRIGIPNGLENSIFQIGKLIVTGIIAGLGTPSITSNSIAGNVASFGNLPGNAMGLALITVVGQCVGAFDFNAVKYYTRKLLKITYIVMGGLNIALMFVAPLIIRIYGVSEITGGFTRQLITYNCITASIIWPLAFALPNALRAANDVKYTMCISIASMWIWRIGFSYVLVKGFGLGVLGVWIAMTIDWLFRAVCFVYRFHKEKYRKAAQV